MSIREILWSNWGRYDWIIFVLGAVNAFLNTVGENPMTYVNARTAGLINARLDDLSRLHVVRDDQLAKAVEIAGTYVK